MTNKIKSLLLITGIIILISGSCKKTYPPPIDFERQIGTKIINQLVLDGDDLWVVSSDPTNIFTFVAIIPPYQVSVYNLKDGRFTINNKIPAITSLAVDKNKTPFISTWDNRILKLNDDLSYEEKLSIPQKHNIQRFMFDQNNYLMIATNVGGLYISNGTDTLRFDSSNSVLNSNFIQSLAKDSRSDIWLVQGSELFKIGADRAISRDPNLFPSEHLSGAFNLSADKDNALWITRWDGNSHRIFRKSINGPWTIIDPPKSSNDRPVKFLRSDSEGTIWIAYSQYPKDLLAYYDSDRWVEVRIPIEEININDVVVYNGELIIGTAQGIYRMVGK
jgi:ligand-binding sensor domain-containing protein